MTATPNNEAAHPMPPNNPMTEGEALAVLRRLKDALPKPIPAHAVQKAIRKARKIADGATIHPAQGTAHADGMRRACSIIESALTAHTAASGGEVAERVAVLTAHRACHAAEHDPANGRLHGYCIVCGVPFPCDYVGEPPAKRPPPAAVPADALERLDSRLRTRMAETEGALKGSWLHWQHETYSWIANELAALIPKGADHGQR